MISVNGILYGTTLSGGANGNGSIFSINPDGSGFSTLYSFTASDNYGDNSDGSQPVGGLISVNGILYGTTEHGGLFGFGSVFSFDPSTNTETAIYSFSGGTADGAYPQTSLINVNGLLYATTVNGGDNNSGTVFSIDTFSHAEKILYNFGASASDGSYPYASLINVNGILYGTTSGGGSLSDGTVFSLDLTSGAEHILHTFTGTNLNNDGAAPRAGLLDVNGVLYGVSYYGGIDNLGTVFSINANGSDYVSLYSFTGSAGDGAQPVPALININGKLFGTTQFGGFNSGTVFSFDPSTQAETTLYRFTATDGSGHNADGSRVYAGLLSINGLLYGVGQTGGTNGDGTIFSLAPVSPPTAVNDKYLLKYATAYAVHAPGVLANDNNGGQTPLTAKLVTNVAHGTLTFNSDGSFLYTPAAGFVGTDSFTYKAANPRFQGNSATVSLVVQAVVPVAHNDAYIPTYNKAYAVKAPGVLANDFNGDNQTMTAALVAGPTHGTLTFNSDGSFLYTSKLGFAGTDTFTYQAIDPIGKSNTATVTFTIHPIVPIAYNDTYAPKYATAFAVKAPGVLANDDTGGTTPLTATLVTSPTHGTLTFNSDGSFLYTPATGFVGSDTFTYKNSTSVGTSNTATVTLKVMAAVPLARNDAYTVKHNTALSVNAATGVLANDYAGDNGTLTAALVTSTTHGSLAFHSDGSFVYTPSAGYSGTDTFTYKDTNPIGTGNTATVTLTVQ